MKALTLFLLGCSVHGIAQCVQSNVAPSARFNIVVNNKIGFIDSSGKVVIAAQFNNAQEFSEGLCAVRINGHYGFIDTSGKVCINPQYDYAMPFSEGLALVFDDGKPLFIAADGNMVIPPHYKEMTSFRHGRARVKTYSGKIGMINRKGDLVIDTIFTRIGEFYDGVAVVQGLEHDKPTDDDKKVQVSIINEEGDLIIPYGKYESISDCSEGYMEATTFERKGGNVGIGMIIDKKGNTIHKLPVNEVSWHDGQVHSNIFRVTREKRKRSKRSSYEYYDEYYDTDGKLVYSNKSVRIGYDFSENFAFIEDQERRLGIINRKGEVVARYVGFALIGGGFMNGRAFVKNTGGWNIIDTTARVLHTIPYQTIHLSIPENGVSKYIIFETDNYSSESNGTFGVMDRDGNILVKPILDQVDQRGFINGLLKASIEKRLVYFNEQGEKVWQQETPATGPHEPMNIDYMNRGYFYAKQNNTGHGNSRYAANQTTQSEDKTFLPDAVSVSVDADSPVSFHGIAAGMTVYLANNTKDTVWFNAQDSRLYMNMQAKDADGNWRDIEYLPSSWCGNSYHSLSLAPSAYWTLLAPRYDGSMPTKLRIQVRIVAPADVTAIDTRREDRTYHGRRQLTIFSNEFDGRINLAQFWRKPDYYPSGIMDPYNE
jgi:hypothetical protein